MLFQDPSHIEEYGTVATFNSAYPETNALKGCAVAALASDTSGNPDTTAIVTMRTFIQNGTRAKSDQKYVVGVRFCSFGDTAIIDVISFDKGFHKEITYEHLKRQEWSMFNEHGDEIYIDEFAETTRAPFVVVGGHLKVDSDNQVAFSGASGDYGKDIFFSESNAIAAYIASVCGLEVIEGDKKKGEAFVSDLLEIMLKHKLKPDFYEQFVDEVYQRRNDLSKMFTAQHCGALITMKAFDRASNEDENIFRTLIDEYFGGGLSRYFLMANLAHRTKQESE